MQLCHFRWGSLADQSLLGIDPSLFAPCCLSQMIVTNDLFVLVDIHLTASSVIALIDVSRRSPMCEWIVSILDWSLPDAVSYCFDCANFCSFCFPLLGVFGYYWNNRLHLFIRNWIFISWREIEFWDWVRWDKVALEGQFGSRNKKGTSRRCSLFRSSLWFYYFRMTIFLVSEYWSVSS